ncbi:hypothetical protein GJ744_006168 [Endocarpon pusillum]|uniref:Uncharacterized protein n=1 Tax=Endocarpon pusillum TaxID=364733 RepID=A0A8H7A6K0_9EURO|nr:hypothetical protein GJ744_006168 [Endocarpon pusillum]
MDSAYLIKSDLAFVYDPNLASYAVVSFDAVQVLRDLHDDVMALSAHCNGDLKVIRVLRRQQMTEADILSLETFSTLLEGYNESLKVLQNRVQNTVELIAYALDTKKQDAAAKLNEHIAGLTTETMDDNATVKLITVFSLIYLPGSFVGTFYGMNFFGYNNKTRRIEIGENFWIYVVTWVGLTLITMIFYRLFRMRHETRKRKTHRLPLMPTKWASEP